MHQKNLLHINLFESLHKWAAANDENFITESFAYILNLYKKYDSESFDIIIKKITNNIINSNSDLSSLTITTQFHTENGTPDIKIENTDILVFIEVKVDSGFGNDQLGRYKKVLSTKNKKTALITITRSSELYGADIKPDLSITWLEIYENLLRMRKKCSNLIGCFLTDEYTCFLKTRGLIMTEANWQLTEGIKSLKRIMDMIDRAIKLNNLNIHSRSGAWDWMGYYIENKKFFIGLYYGNPNSITINTEVPLIENIPSTTEVGLLRNRRWENQLILDSEDVHFFSRTALSQLECIKLFIENSVKYGNSLIKN